MSTMSLERTLLEVQKLLKEDPRQREYHFAACVVQWLLKLEPHPSEPLLLAAWGHTLSRWKVPRENFAKTTEAYHQWREATAQKAADEMRDILSKNEFSDEFIRKTDDLILKTNFPQDPESRLLEDAD